MTCRCALLPSDHGDCMQMYLCTALQTRTMQRFSLVLGGPAHLLYLSSITSMPACHAVHILCIHLAIIVLCLHLSLLTLLLGFMLLLHVLNVGTGIPICWHLRYGKVPLATCQHSTRLNQPQSGHLHHDRVTVRSETKHLET